MLGNRTWEFQGERFELKDVPAAPVRLRVRTADGMGGEALLSPEAGAAAEVEMSVKGLAGVRGRVLDGATKAPVPEALVFIEDERPRGQTMEPRGMDASPWRGGPGRADAHHPGRPVPGELAHAGDAGGGPGDGHGRHRAQMTRMPPMAWA